MIFTHVLRFNGSILISPEERRREQQAADMNRVFGESMTNANFKQLLHEPLHLRMPDKGLGILR